MKEQNLTEPILSMFKKYNIDAKHKFLRLSDAFNLVICILETKVERLERFANEMAEHDCTYGDNCPPFGTRHGQCTGCAAREALEEAK